ncbi:NAD-dependent epimerase/dehydratase family protein [Streptomyces angustmyceticus]|uniref:UDP-glucose 4-epimerase n=1 Tax=Streptomyces angustmyceticus TaxID=285578 RepID=A0A5J4LUP9_9ACTN|nr:NAD(P)-dependent oxidoreductase [Streptomyces angustmyceticus]UAL71819.1 NAD(P)-dependent oxidoreductase [Streptomyces angustmyceticus]GES33998.1 UDP-glucose 4-epimerase [Streptomyces angustmyceticus]
MAPSTPVTGPVRVAVLGATGCMGRHLCAAFSAEGSEVVAVARRYAPQVAAHRFLPLDVAGTTSGELARVLAHEDVDVVVNATLGWGDELHYANVQLVERLLDALALLKTPPRLVHLGTIHEYGPVPLGTSVHEGTEPAPENPYAKAKLTASRMVLDAARDGALDGVVLRVANTLGPHPALESFFGSLAVRLRGADAATGIELTIADARRDYVDVRDAVDAVVRAARIRHADPLVNIGCGRAQDVRTLVDELVAAAGLPAETIRERRGEVRSRGADWIQVDISRAARLLGWRPRYTLGESMRAMWDTVGADQPLPDRHLG